MEYLWFFFFFENYICGLGILNFRPLNENHGGGSSHLGVFWALDSNKVMQYYGLTCFSFIQGSRPKKNEHYKRPRVSS